MFFRTLLFLLILVLIPSCSYYFITRVTFNENRAHVSSLYCNLIGKDQKITRPVIFMAGTKGSTLSQNGTSIWLRPLQIVRNTSPLTYNKNELPVIADGLLTRLSFIPGLLEYAPYQRISSFLACQPQAYFFAYDWRKSPLDHLPALDTLVERVRTETGQMPSLIAHSMGGLVTHSYLKTNADKIDRVVYVSVPFQPGTGFLADLMEGSANGLNKTILSKEALFSHPGSFALLPHGGQKLYKGQDLMLPETWMKNQLSVFKEGNGSEALLKENIAQAKAFQTVLDTPKKLTNRFLFVIGNCQKTHESINVDGSIFTLPGDGRVPADAAYPVEKESLTKETFISCAEHDKQLGDSEVLKKIVDFLSSAS